MLEREYRRAGEPLRPTAARLLADQILTEKKPLGRIESSLRAAGLLARFASNTITLFRDHDTTTPDWMRPPPQACYRFDPLRPQDWVLVEVHPEGKSVLGRARDEAAFRVAPFAAFDVWLRDPTSTGTVEVLVGDQPVGTLTGDAAAAFGPLLDAAASYGEYPVCRAHLTWPDPNETLLLELPLPSPDTAEPHTRPPQY